MLTPAPPALGQAGQAGAFLRQEASARGAALGGALAGAADDTSALSWNPAGLSRLIKPEIQATHVLLFEDTAYDFISAGFATKRWGGLAVGYVRQSSGGFERRASPNDPAVSFAIIQSAVAAGWGRAFQLPLAGKLPLITNPKPLELGLSVKSVRESIDTFSASGNGLDLGLTFRPQERLAVGLHIQNLIAPSLTFVSQPIAYPRVVSVAPALLWPLSPDWRSLFALKVSKAEQENAVASGGVEMQYRRLAALRVGVQEKGISSGAGVRFGNTQLDYAALLHELGVSHQVTFIQRFGQTREELEETIRRGIQALTKSEGVRLSKAYLQKAEAELREERTSEALRHFEAALLLDPDNMETRERIRRISARWEESVRRQMVERTADLARQQRAQGNLLASRQYWKGALELEPRHPEAKAELEAIDKALSREEQEKLDSLRRAQADNEVRQSLAVAGAFQSRGQFRQAKAEAEKAARRFPDSAELAELIRKLRAQLQAFVAEKSAEADRLIEDRDLEGALRAVEEGLREEPGKARLEEKALSLRQSLRKTLTPEERRNIERLYYRAVEQYLKGNFEAANELAKEVMRQDPSSEAARRLKERVEAALRYSQ